MTQAFIGSGYIENILTGEVNEFVQGYRGESALPIGLAMRTKFNPNRNSAWFGSVMEVINNITMLSIVLTGAAVIREREHGTLEHLLVMPLTPFEIMMAKIWAMGLVVLMAAALSLYFVVQGLLQVPIAGSVAPLPVWCHAASVRHHLHGYFYGHRRTFHAAARPTDDSGYSALADALRRYYAA